MRSAYIAATLTSPLHAPVSAGVSASRGEKEREVLSVLSLLSIPSSFFPFFLSFFFFLISINPRHEGMKAGVSWHGRIKGKGCCESRLSFDKGQGRGSGGQHTAGTKTGFLE